MFYHILFINNNARKKGEQIKTTDYVMIQIMIPESNVYVHIMTMCSIHFLHTSPPSLFNRRAIDAPLRIFSLMFATPERLCPNSLTSVRADDQYWFGAKQPNSAYNTCLLGFQKRRSRASPETGFCWLHITQTGRMDTTRRETNIVWVSNAANHSLVTVII